MPITDDLLSLRGIGQRATSYQFMLLDQNERTIGELHPYRGESTPIITFDSTRQIARDMSNFNLAPSEYSNLDPLSARIQPYMILENGDRESLGVFVFADASRPQYSYGESFAASLTDKGFILDQPVEQSVSVATGQSIREAIVRLLDAIDIASVVDSSITYTGGPMSWAAGTSRLRIINDLATAGAYMPAWFDRHGVCQMRSVANTDAADPSVTYRDGENIFAASAVQTDDLLKTPNRTIVVSSDVTDEPIVGAYNAPASAPYSATNRGFVVAEVINQQGIASGTAAAEAARAYAKSRRIFENLTFSGPPDWRHDGYTAVDYNGEKWIEQMWSLTLGALGPMTHTIRRVYVDE